MKKEIIQESVRGIVEFILRSGSIDNRFVSNKRALEGTRAHQKLQKSNEEIYTDYKKEVYLTKDFDLDNFILKIEGRADGIIIEDDKVIIEEIKSTYRELIEITDENELHWAQAKFYGFIHFEELGIDEGYIQLSYYQLNTDEVKSFRRKYTLDELGDFVFEIIDRYEKYVKVLVKHKEKRNKSIKKLEFPFKDYREGQLKLARAVYGTIRDKGLIFVEAPTGIGKTISTIFPSVKSIGEGLKEKIFYLTAKNVNRKVAEETYDILRGKGLKFRTLTITAKEKMCLNEKVSCNPEDCPYALNYYDKSRNVIFDIMKNKVHLGQNELKKIGEKEGLCPFELSLDLIEWADSIICDYNYIFDPRVGLKRVVEDVRDDLILLVDEGHNLVDRGRDMYSASLNKESILNLRKVLKGKIPNIYKILGTINKSFVEFRHECESEGKDSIYFKEEPDKLYKNLRRFLSESEELLPRLPKESFYEDYMNVYFDINKFISISELYSDEYVTYIESIGRDLTVTLFCIDPSKKLKSIIDKISGTVIFSATISPIDYYMDLLGGDEKSYRLRLESPFDKENLKVSVAPINTRFLKRRLTINDLLKKVIDFVNSEVGNYFVFFPSYDYLELALENLDKESLSRFQIITQDRVMNEEDRSLFLNKFKEERNVLGFAVLGGVFSEGIDLPGKSLIGSVVVGVGYPKISMEREIIKDYYDEKGYDYSYIYPGVNKVLQAVGRVIRTEEDRGRALLVDDRYLTKKYKRLLHESFRI